MSIDLDDIESRIATGIYGDDRLSKEERNDAFSALAEILAEVERLRQALDATEKERDQWHDAALDRRQALHDADALRTGVYFALRPEGGADGWRPSRGVDALIDLALTVREDAEDAEKGAAACDQIVALLDGFPVESPRPEAARVAALLAEVADLRLQREGNIIDNMHAYEEGVAEGERRVVVYLRRETYPCCNQCNNQLADYIERGEHRREEGR